MQRTLPVLTAAAALALPAGALADGHGNGHGQKHGNSWAAHACRHGGYHSLVGSDGRTFRNVGACVRFAAHGGRFSNIGSAARLSADGFVIPAGAVASISGAQWNLNPCDALSYGYQLDGNAPVTLASKAGGVCANGSLAGATIGPFSSDTHLRIFLTDAGSPATSCNYTFFSNGSHALVSGSNPWRVDIRDSSSCTIGPGAAPLVPSAPGQGNLDLVVTVTGPTVSGTAQGEHAKGHEDKDD
jgi:hypothetical protein